MRLLLVEDKDSFRRLLVQALAPPQDRSDAPLDALAAAASGAWEVTAVGDPASALQALDAAPYGILVTDLRLPGMSGLELLKAAKRRHPALRAVLMSAFGEPRDIVEAMRWGADDFLPKPFDLDRFAAVLERLRALAEAPPPDPREPWVVHSPAMRALDQALAKAADTAFPVLFHGEPGAGKARAARRLHVLRHPRRPSSASPPPACRRRGPTRAAWPCSRAAASMCRTWTRSPRKAAPNWSGPWTVPWGRGCAGWAAAGTWMPCPSCCACAWR